MINGLLNGFPASHGVPKLAGFRFISMEIYHHLEKPHVFDGWKIGVPLNQLEPIGCQPMMSTQWTGKSPKVVIKPWLQDVPFISGVPDVHWQINHALAICTTKNSPGSKRVMFPGEILTGGRYSIGEMFGPKITWSCSPGQSHLEKQSLPLEPTPWSPALTLLDIEKALCTVLPLSHSVQFLGDSQSYQGIWPFSIKLPQALLWMVDFMDNPI